MSERTAERARQPIVVGVDGSPDCLVAVEWAAREANDRGVPLVVVHVDAVDVHEEAAIKILEDIARFDNESLAAGVERALKTAPDLSITAKLLNPPTIDRLLEESANASLLVVGSRGLGALRSMLLGSVSSACAAAANCPVVVVNGARAAQ